MVFKWVIISYKLEIEYSTRCILILSEIITINFVFDIDYKPQGVGVFNTNDVYNRPSDINELIHGPLSPSLSLTRNETYRVADLVRVRVV